MLNKIASNKKKLKHTPKVHHTSIQCRCYVLKIFPLCHKTAINANCNFFFIASVEFLHCDLQLYNISTGFTTLCNQFYRYELYERYQMASKKFTLGPSNSWVNRLRIDGSKGKKRYVCMCTCDWAKNITQRDRCAK